MSDEVYGMILEKSKTVDPTNFNKVRAYTLVLMCINTGGRNKEIRFAKVRDLDTTSWLFDIIHVKGEATYGQPREVPIPPEIHQLILTYLLARQKWIVDNSVKSQALFSSNDSDQDSSPVMRSGRSRRWWKQISASSSTSVSVAGRSARGIWAATWT